MRAPDPIFVSVPEAARLLACSVRQVYALVADPTCSVCSVKDGGRRKVVYASIVEHGEQLKADASVRR